MPNNRDPDWPESIDPPCGIVVYICPTEGCGNYQASKTFRPDLQPDMHKIQERRTQDGQKVHTIARVDCPDCYELGLRVPRVPYIVTSVLPLADALRQSERDAVKIKKKLILVPAIEPTDDAA